MIIILSIFLTFLEASSAFLYNGEILPGRLMVGQQTLDLLILGSTPSPAANSFNV